MVKIKQDQLFKTENLDIPYFFTNDYCLNFLGILLRDITGRDLTYLDFVRTSLDEHYTGSLHFIFQFLERFVVDNPGKYFLNQGRNPLKSLTLELLIELFEVYLEKVIRVPMSRDNWLKNVYYLNGGKYTSLNSFEDIPMTEFLYMISVHNDYHTEKK